MWLKGPDRQLFETASQSLALDPGWVRAALSQVLRDACGGVSEVVDLGIVNRWSGRKRITILYRARLRLSDGSFIEQDYTGYVIPGERLRAEYARIGARGTIHPRSGRAVLFLEEAKLILLALPNDRKMSVLSEADLMSWLDRHLDEAAGRALSGHHWRVEETRIETVRYVPEKRLTLVCRARLREPGGSEEAISFVAKQYGRAARAAMAFRNLESLYRAWSRRKEAPDGGRSAGERSILRVPRPLGLDPERAVVFIERVAGMTALDALATADVAALIVRVGRCLADLHALPLRVQRTISRRSEMKELRRSLTTIEEALPRLSLNGEKTLKEFERAGELDTAPDVLLHGTYRLNHLIVGDGRLIPIDLDSLRSGHPAYDVSNFLASLFYLEAEKRLATPVRLDICRHFLRGYADSAPFAVSARDVLWFFASLMINKQAVKYLKHLHDHREAKVISLLTVAGRALGLARRSSADLSLADLWNVLPGYAPAVDGRASWTG